MTKIKLTADMFAPSNPYNKLKITHPYVKALAERYARWKGLKVDDITFYKAVRDDFESYVLRGVGEDETSGRLDED